MGRFQRKRHDDDGDDEKKKTHKNVYSYIVCIAVRPTSRKYSTSLLILLRLFFSITQSNRRQKFRYSPYSPCFQHIHVQNAIKFWLLQIIFGFLLPEFVYSFFSSFSRDRKTLYNPCLLYQYVSHTEAVSFIPKTFENNGNARRPFSVWVFFSLFIYSSLLHTLQRAYIVRALYVYLYTLLYSFMGEREHRRKRRKYWILSQLRCRHECVRIEWNCCSWEWTFKWKCSSCHEFIMKIDNSGGKMWDTETVVVHSNCILVFLSIFVGTVPRRMEWCWIRHWILVHAWHWCVRALGQRFDA